MPGIPLFHRIASDTLFALTCDLVVFCNLVYIGVEVDFGSNESLAEPFFWCRVGFLIWCGLEFAIRILGGGGDFFKLRNLCEMVGCAALDVILFNKPGWLWRFSGLRSWRMLRVYQFARTSTRLKELSLVLDSMIRSSKALLYLALVMGGAYWSAGAWSRGILEANGTFELMDQTWVYEYWGQSVKAAFTMFQLSTNDGWAASVVRPILDLDVFGGLLLLLYTWVTSCTLLSLGIGVMVWATVEEARSGGDHGSHIRALEDKEAMQEIRSHFEQSLMLQDRNFIDYQELRDALSIPEILGAIQHLEMPVSDALTLFEHVDVMQSGRITLEDLMGVHQGAHLQGHAIRHLLPDGAHRRHGHLHHAPRDSHRCGGLGAQRAETKVGAGHRGTHTRVLGGRRFDVGTRGLPAKIGTHQPLQGEPQEPLHRVSPGACGESSS